MDFHSSRNVDTILIITGKNFSDTSRVILEARSFASSVSEAHLQPLLNIYPNPSNSQVNIELPANYVEWRLTLYDILGHAIESKNGIGSESKVVFDTHALPTGVYSILTTMNGGISVDRLVVTH